MLAQIFVYGSLLSGSSRPEAARLAAEGLYLGPATVHGRLYRVSWYPALLAPQAANERVQGEVYRLVAPATSLRWLDAYEGIGAESPGVAGDAYERRIVTATFADGRNLGAWVYVHGAVLPEADRIAAGCWRA